jgi:hypothetical protein
VRPGWPAEQDARGVLEGRVCAPMRAEQSAGSSGCCNDGGARRTAIGGRACDNQGMTKAELHELVDRLPDRAVDGAAILLEEIGDGRIDPEQAWFWTHEWQVKEHEADDDFAAGRATRYESDEEFLAALDERTKPLDADA